MASWMRGLLLVTVSTLPKLSHRFKAIPVRLSAKLLVGALTF